MVSEVAAVAKNWWLFVVLGSICLIAGVLAIVWPGTSLLAIVIALGIFLVAEGVIRVVRAFEARENRGWAIGLGGFDVLMGIIILAWPGIGLVTLAVFFALTMLTRGAFAVVAGLQLRKLRHAGEPPPAHTAAVA